MTDTKNVTYVDSSAILGYDRRMDLYGMAGSDFLPFALAVIVMFITTRKYIRQYAAQHSAEGHS